MLMLGTSRWAYKEERPDTGGSNKRRRQRNSARPTPFRGTGGPRVPTHTVRGRNDERYMIRGCVIDRRDSCLVFRGFRPAIVSCPETREEEGEWMRSAAAVRCTPGISLPQAKTYARCGARPAVKPPAALAKRKVIGTIENTRLLCLAGGVRSRTYICLVAERQVNIRPHSKTASSCPSVSIFLFSLPLSFHSLPLSLFQGPPRPADILKYPCRRRSAAPIRRCSLSAAPRAQSSSSNSVQTFD